MRSTTPTAAPAPRWALGIAKEFAIGDIPGFVHLYAREEDERGYRRRGQEPVLTGERDA